MLQVKAQEIIETYKNILQDFFDKQIKTKNNCILFFQGFPGAFYKALEELNIQRFCNSPANEKGYIDYSSIKPFEVLQNFLNSKSISWGYYEELLVLTDVLNDLNMYSGDIMVVTNNLFSVYYPIDISIPIERASKIFESETLADTNDELFKYYSDFKVLNGTGFFSYVNKHYEIDTNKKITELPFFKGNRSTENEDGNPESTIALQDIADIKIKMQNGAINNQNYLIKTLNGQTINEYEALKVFGSYMNVSFKSEVLSRDFTNEDHSRHIQLFKKYWGATSEYRELPVYKEPAMNTDTVQVSQGFLISDIINQCENALKGLQYSDLIITAPTGAGKSVFFQVPGIYLHENHQLLTIIITPLIALMRDQVKEITERGIDFATYINSEITFEERQERLSGIQSGQYSLVYLSPELLLSSDISNIIGDRKLGLLVVDEAHLVTSWGRDFRVDYWFLGDYLEKARRGNYYSRAKTLNFPILCLTATAVYGGRDDVVGDLQNSLHLNCSSEHLYIGYVRRNNIGFKISKREKELKSFKDDKASISSQRIREFIRDGQKAIVYFPFVSQVEEVYRTRLDTPEFKGNVVKYSGSGMDKFEKNESYNTFRDSKASVMLATKAFGMGVNIPDISTVYHYAPTGTLADYVQEIGRAARQLPKGYAMIDYLPNDMHYAMTLWGLSGLRHYQIRAIMKKLYDLYLLKKSRNLLFSPDVFSYLFDANNVDNKVKSGLMLLSSDLLEKYHFKVLTVRPKNIFSMHYIHVPKEIEQDFMHDYGEYCEAMTDDKPKVTPAHGWNSEVVTYNANKIYEINLSRIWENEFNDMTFAKFKYLFFSGELFAYGEKMISPRIKLVIHYDKTYETAKSELARIIAALQKTFLSIHRKFGGSDFTFQDFRSDFDAFYQTKLRKEYLAILLDMFCYTGVYFDEIPTEQWKFIEKRKNEDHSQFSDSKYSIRASKHSFIEQTLKRFLVQCAPNSQEGTSFITYLCIPHKSGKYSEYQLLASILELFDLATYELLGGRNPMIFVRLNDPLKLKRIAETEKEYRNLLLTNIEEKHKRSAKIVDRFMSLDLNDTERWALIENYFLGYDGLVDTTLGIED